MRAPLLLAAAEAPSTALVVVIGILTLFATVVGWPMLTHVITIAHEGGHATAASWAGGSVTSVRLERTGGGNTAFTHSGGKGAVAFIGSAGYLGPSVFGLLGSVLLVHGQVEPVLWTSLVLVAVLLLNVSNPFGWFTTLLSGAALFVVARYAPDGVQTLFAVAWVWFLLFGAYNDVIGLRKVRRALKVAKEADDKTDAGILGSKTWVPAPIWVAFFWLGAVASLVLGAGILLGLLEPVPAPAAPLPTPT